MGSRPAEHRRAWEGGRREKLAPLPSPLSLPPSSFPTITPNVMTFGFSARLRSSFRQSTCLAEHKQNWNVFTRYRLPILLGDYRVVQKCWCQVARKVQHIYGLPSPAMPGRCLTKQSLFYAQHCRFCSFSFGSSSLAVANQSELAY